MYILFLCGSLAPSQDGVGDYTRLLASELSNRGFKIAVCAIADRFCLVPTISGGKLDEPGAISCLRLPSSLCWKAKRNEFKGWLGASNPSLVSLQYVPYSFDSRGLPFGLAKWLNATVPRDVGWHVMFHESWIGITRKSPWKHHLVGAFQKYIAQNLVNNLNPVICHTSNVLYVTILGDAGIRAVRLPICSSIPISFSENEWMREKLAELGISSTNRNQWWIAGMFGSCHADVPLEMHVQNVIKDAAIMGRKPIVLGIGGGSGTGASWEARVKTCLPDTQIHHFGRQSDARVSAFLSSLDYGLPNSPREYLAKSSAAAAMQAHGVPLNAKYHVDLPEYKGRWDENISDENLFLSLSQIADRFIEDCKLGESSFRL